MLILRSDKPFPAPPFPVPERILFIDIDDTVRMGYSTLGHYVNKADEVEIFPRAIIALQHYKDFGYLVVGVTNQGGIGEGFQSEADCVEALARTNELALNLFDVIIYCPHTTADWCHCRKPNPGMIHRILSWVPELMAISRRHMLMVGDRMEDKKLAFATGITFLPAEEWRKTTIGEKENED